MGHGDPTEAKVKSIQSRPADSLPSRRCLLELLAVFLQMLLLQALGMLLSKDASAREGGVVCTSWWGRGRMGCCLNSNLYLRVWLVPRTRDGTNILRQML